MTVCQLYIEIITIIIVIKNLSSVDDSVQFVQYYKSTKTNLFNKNEESGIH